MEKSHLRPMYRTPETPIEPMEFLSRSWSVSADEISKVLAPSSTPDKTHRKGYGFGGGETIREDISGELETASGGVSLNPFFFATDTSQIVLARIMAQTDVSSPRTSGRLSHSSGPLNGSLTDSPPPSPSEIDDTKYYRLNIPFQYKSCAGGGSALNGGGKTVGRWLKDRREKKKEEARTHNAQLHAAISVAGVAAAIAAIAAATAASSRGGKDEQRAKTDMAVASAATLVAAQCVEAAEIMGAERGRLTAVVSSAVNVRSAGDIMTLTAAAATALRGAATLKARSLKEVWNIASVTPLEKGVRVSNVQTTESTGSSQDSFSGELYENEDFLGICNRELLARGCELLKRTRRGDLHWKVVSVYINQIGQVILKMKSRHVAGTITKKKKNIVLEVLEDIPAWPGRHLLEGGEDRRYFALKTIARGVVEFECRNQKEYDIWTQGISRLLSFVGQKNNLQKLS